jgi:hypothetical protein
MEIDAVLVKQKQVPAKNKNTYHQQTYLHSTNVIPRFKSHHH